MKEKNFLNNFIKNAATDIVYIKNPSEEVQLAGVKEDGYAIGYIDNPSEKVQLAAIRKAGWEVLKDIYGVLSNKIPLEILLEAKLNNYTNPEIERLIMINIKEK